MRSTPRILLVLLIACSFTCGLAVNEAAQPRTRQTVCTSSDADLEVVLRVLLLDAKVEMLREKAARLEREAAELTAACRTMRPSAAPEL